MLGLFYIFVIIATKDGEGEMKMNKKLTKREKLLICTAFVTTCAAGYFGYKYLGDHKQI